MGQTQSRRGDQDLSQIYSAYIQQQQNLIFQQQQQINSILRHQGPGQGSQGQPNYPRIMPSRQQQQQQQQRQGQQRQRQGRQQQQHWNIVRKSCPIAGHGPTLASTVEKMRVHLDAEKCQGHNRCYALAPELFDVDDYGQAMLLVEGDVPAELQDKARLAASNCPEYAITITENG